MSTKSAVLLTTNESTSNEEKETFEQYLSSQLTNLKLIYIETCQLDKENDMLTKTIKTWIDKCDTVLIISKITLIAPILSKIFNEKLILNNHVNAIHKTNSLTNDTQNILIPNSSKIFQFENHVNEIKSFCINYRNVYILPDDLNSIKAIFQNPINCYMFNDLQKEPYTKHFVLHCNQNGVGHIINEALNNLKNSLINIQKYCFVNNEQCELNIILSSSNFISLVKYEHDLKTMIPRNLIRKENICDNFWGKFELLAQEEFVQQSLDVIKQCYSDYEPGDIFLSFNGGKDCTVLLYLTIYVLKTLYPGYKEPLLCLYIQSQDPFQEVEEFIDQCREFYNLELVTIRNSVKVGLEEILMQRPNLKACLMGTRRTDPYAQHLKHFQMTDPHWPQVMRVNPVLDWNYSDIWNFLLTCNIPYCQLYDLGYTSLGGKTNTEPNPALKSQNKEPGGQMYLPAYKLEDGSKERNGRQVRK